MVTPGHWRRSRENSKLEAQVPNLSRFVSSGAGHEPICIYEAFIFFCNSNSVVCVGTGCSVAWLMQAFEVKEGQRVLDHCNNMAMGWSIPGGIASCFASPTSEVICVIGDGSLMMTTHELETIAKHNLPTKSLVSDNVGHSTIRQTLDQWFASDYFASPPEGGLP